MAADALAHCLLLEHCDALDRAAAAALLSAFDDAGSCLAAGIEGWRRAGLSTAAARELAGQLGAAPRRRLRREEDRLRRLAVRALTVCDAGYPALLRTIHRPPPWLYLRGDRDALTRPQVAVVGSRKASPLGLQTARQLAAELCDAGLAVTSGLALGIDGAAHRGALAAGGPTVAVMATGIDRVYPRRHGDLAEAIADRGCLLSELPPGTAPRKHQFPARNRLISGMALGTVVVEAALPSGSLLTADAAAAQGRDVYAVPWSIHHRGGRGCLQLLRDGAGLVASAADVTASLGWPGIALPSPPPGHAGTEEAASGLSPLAGRVLAALADTALPADTVAVLLAEPAPAVLGALGELEIAGRVQRAAGGYRRLG